MAICKICNKNFTTEKGLSYHITYSHNISLENYYLKYECENSDNIGKCVVCGKPTVFISRLYGYQKTCGPSCGGKAGAKQGHETMLLKYGKKALNNPQKNKEFYENNPEAKKAAIAKLVAARKANNSYVLGGYKAKITRETRIADFLAKNDCIPPYTLVRQYGQGWYKAQSKILAEDDYVFNDTVDGNTTYFIKRAALPKIENYFKENEFNQTSHGEKSVINYLKEISDFEIIENSRQIISPLELDIYIPDKKLAIEYNGTYWHSNQAGIDEEYHFLKSYLCEQLGIRLIHIYEFEWDDPIKKRILKSIIKNALGLNDSIIYARKCELKELNKKDVEEFSNINSLHAHRNASIYLGLYYNNELVEVMTFGKAFFSKDESINYECIRSITKLDTTVVGGMNKLFTYFIKKYNPNKVLYYVDYNTHIGSSMQKLGFKFISYSKHGIKNVVRDPQKDIELVKKFGYVFNRKPTKHSEIQQLINDKKILTIYDAGVKKYIWEKQ